MLTDTRNPLWVSADTYMHLSSQGVLGGLSCEAHCRNGTKAIHSSADQNMLYSYWYLIN